MIIDGSTTVNTDDLDQYAYRFIDESSMIIDDFPKMFKLISQGNLMEVNFENYFKNTQA